VRVVTQLEDLFPEQAGGDRSADTQPHRTGSAGRRAVAAAAGLAVVAAAGGLVLWPERDRGPEQVLAGAAAPQASAAAPTPSRTRCASSIAGVPDCPVVPATPDPYGRPGPVPPGFRLVHERREVFPSVPERIDLISSRYEGPGDDELLVEVFFGDVGPDGGHELGRALPGVRPETTVHELPTEGSRWTAGYAYLAASRIFVTVRFDAPGLSEQQELAVVAGIS
jgi:hypothetical protein